ncbi:sensor domain-containing diguanylate cyclase [Aquibium sp. LZ166]|uniref:diguanylate cyclase n=1 Tax=Aquibium pacificus TaxID=3153579 RepID=A0ABV3SLE7_9HYPH
MRGAFAQSLRVRVLVLTLGAFVAVGIPGLAAFSWIVGSTTEKLSTLFAERQILYDRYRGLGPLAREVALAETLARSPAIIAWAKDETSPARTARGIDELEHFRTSFRDGSYFLAMAGSGDYYYNDAISRFDRAQLRYRLLPGNDKDAWFYQTLAMGPGCRLNVNNDRALKVTNVWINCVVSADGKPLAVLGTGINLTSFIDEIVTTDQPGVESIFVDASGAVQATREESRIDFASLTKQAADRKTVFNMLDDTQSKAKLGDMMANLLDGRTQAASGFLMVGGKKVLVGVGYLDRLDWFNVTLMDVDAIVGKHMFAPIGGLIALLMLAAAGLITFLFKRSVLDRLALAETSLERIESGDFPPAIKAGHRDEIGRLTHALNRMASAVRDNTNKLEDTVRQRTEQLERMAYLDPMTGIANRRGFADAFADEHRRARAAGGAVGILLLDVDLFKSINDTRGHQAGDEVIIEVARRISAAGGEDEICARWGGDEFVVLVRGCSPETIAATGRRILDAVRSRAVSLSDGAGVRITTSIGAHVADDDDTLSSAAAKADVALYEAKRAGRNRVILFDRERHGRDGQIKVA